MSQKTYTFTIGQLILYVVAMNVVTELLWQLGKAVFG